MSQNYNVIKAEMLPNWNVTKTEIPPEVKCHQNWNVCVYPFSREGGINLFGDHRGSILSNRAEISQEC